MKKLILAIILACSLNAHSQDLIKVINVVHHENGITDFQGEYRVELPAQLQGVINANQIMDAYKGVYNIVKLDTISNIVYAVFIGAPLNLPFLKVVNNITTGFPYVDEDFYDILEAQYQTFVDGLANFSLMPSDAIIGRKWNGSTWNY